ncbi:MAG: endonuclease [Candidatus Micrarchaeia archaeon]
MQPVEPLAQALENIYNKLYLRFGPQHWWPVTTRSKNQNIRIFEIFLGAVLTQQTAWRQVEKAIQNLKKAGLINPKKLAKAKPGKVSNLIKSVAFYPTKAKRLIELAGRWDDIKRISTLPVLKAREGMLKLKGIGPETCDSILLYAFEKPVFVVDVYTRRFVKRYFGIRVNDGKKGYEKIRNFFEFGLSNLREKSKVFNEYHALIVELGKNYCKTVPKCRECPLSKNCMRMIR